MKGSKWLGYVLVGVTVLACDSSSDSDDDDSDPTEEACETLCATLNDCDPSFAEGSCVSRCESAFGSASGVCDAALEDATDCFDAQARTCERASNLCDNEAESLVNVCEDEMRALGLAPTDSCNDASLNTCIYAFDGICDEGIDCAYDTDYYDCYCF